MTPTSPEAGLRLDGITVRYGGRTALSEVSLDARQGRITGLIGPNGAGKTTLFNICSGLLRPAAGRVHFGGADITGLPPQRRAQRGLGRTFQRMELFESLTVRQNVSLGREAKLAGSRPLAQLRASRRDAEETRSATEESLEACRIADLADRPVHALSTGQRRLVELARATASGGSFLLLDEPSSGLDHAETDGFGDILLELVRTRGIGILLVEHDMSLVMRICDHVCVLDFGRMIFDGTAAETSASETVRKAYLGEAA